VTRLWRHRAAALAALPGFRCVQQTVIFASIQLASENCELLSP